MNIQLSHETIAAIVTPIGEGGIGKIVVSGPKALNMANDIFEGKHIKDLCNAENGKLYYGHIVSGNQRIDEVILNVEKQGNSFTGEDVVEINCHGGIRILMRVYELIVSHGAKKETWEGLAAQALENDQIDAIQKEALPELVAARTKLCAKVLLDQYNGALSKTLHKCMDITKQMECASAEGHNTEEEVIFPLKELTHSIDALLNTAPFGMALISPQAIVILGKPNVGKSTLMNAVLGEEQMIVHHEPGTTRDYASEYISIEDIPFEIVDTAGIRKTEDTVESMSIEMTREQLGRADKVLAIFDNSKPLDHEDREILDALKSWKMAKAYERQRAYTIIPLINKTDLPAQLDTKIIESEIASPVYYISAQKKEGLDVVYEKLVEEFNTCYHPGTPVVFNKRQFHLLSGARRMLETAAFSAATIQELRNIFNECLRGAIY
ncbi:GTPase and tRNA-U34 5-formylation enzyme TrmE [Candidatus Kuenenia stuttgartiensis]|uniref:GTPase and tRNA-U34 5-formylation enzyme TrmE n=1 Tax=Kuenenia stuttgartiensis TaxID=174633 RepID=A0A2C9CGY0_KUEST|nr:MULTISPECIES: GTPase [Kuenenia]MBZ0190329.1 50S ribosome-binding GTPase [Candidatus Kuenenia stuttgartiensis]MCF6150959.1 GTP-binding protein [Candidatus Kuenenia stuttgartiensis]MCL4725894.1 50S ribosome-binding GTPase [Candidatus Kuenenia stuttgartiensis]MCZ7623919.1 50S ribosome-binding GTPase [Candidatus Kuenenia sp.]QII10126.1 GTPase and tRNA-U34 5-formylation enzyme TrmE [Candidatus Kuenenia stuttgartiensis]